MKEGKTASIGRIEALGRALDQGFVEEWYRRNGAPGADQREAPERTMDAPELPLKLQLAFAVEVLSCAERRCQSTLANQLVDADWRRPLCRVASVGTVLAGLIAVVAIATGRATMAIIAAVATLSAAVVALFLEYWSTATAGSRVSRELAPRIPQMLQAVAAAKGQLKTFIDHPGSENAVREALASTETLCADILIHAGVLLESEAKDDREIVAPLQA